LHPELSLHFQKQREDFIVTSDKEGLGQWYPHYKLQQACEFQVHLILDCPCTKQPNKQCCLGFRVEITTTKRGFEQWKKHIHFVRWFLHILLLCQCLSLGEFFSGETAKNIQETETQGRNER
jgi:hypothetical protein